MAGALFDRASEGRHKARSAGTKPAGRVHPVVVETMVELGIDLSSNVPTRLEGEDAEWADVVVTMGCGDVCPVLPGKRYEDWVVGDPALASPAGVAAIRDELDRRVRELLAEILPD
jgi:protein-tyrosine-phosphatase